MANYPPYQYQPQQMGYQPHQMGYQAQMQPMFQQYQQPVPQQEQLFCRPVASVDEARGIPVDFSGKPMILPHLNAGRIYVKAFDPASGSSVIREFRAYEEPPETQQTVAYAPMSEVEQLKQIVFDLQNELKAIKGGKRKAQQEVSQDEL